VAIYLQEAVIFKFTNAVCESFNKSWAVVNTCRLRAISRNMTILNINVTLLHAASNVLIDVQMFKRANGYKPWLFKFTVDVCRFVSKSYNPAAKLFFSVFKEYTNMNHTCPYICNSILNIMFFQGDQLVTGLYLRPELVRLPLPSGDYLISLIWMLNNKQQLMVNVYFSFV
ncbi:hypothetical protein KR044_008401, partial [Drosophila immigrans]